VESPTVVRESEFLLCYVNSKMMGDVGEDFIVWDVPSPGGGNGKNCATTQTKSTQTHFSRNRTTQTTTRCIVKISVRVPLVGNIHLDVHAPDESTLYHLCQLLSQVTSFIVVTFATPSNAFPEQLAAERKRASEDERRGVSH
jgi:hypothetical protein